MTKLYKAIAVADVITDILPGISLIKNIALIAYKSAKKTDQVANPNRKSADFRIYAASKKTSLSLVASIPVLGNIAALILHVKYHSTSFLKRIGTTNLFEFNILLKAYLERNPTIADKELIAAHSLADKKQCDIHLPHLIARISNPTFECIKEGVERSVQIDPYLQKFGALTDEQLTELLSVASSYAFGQIVVHYPDKEYGDDETTMEKMRVFALAQIDKQDQKDSVLKNYINQHSLLIPMYDHLLSGLSENAFWDTLRIKSYEFTRITYERPLEKLTQDRIQDFKEIFAEKLKDTNFQSYALTYVIEKKHTQFNDFSVFAQELAGGILEKDQKAFVKILYDIYKGWLFPFNETPEGNPFFSLLFDTFYERLSEENKELLKASIQNYRHDSQERQKFDAMVRQKLNLEAE